jgi:hypothetical protein
MEQNKDSKKKSCSSKRSSSSNTAKDEKEYNEEKLIPAMSSSFAHSNTNKRTFSLAKQFGITEVDDHEEILYYHLVYPPMIEEEHHTVTILSAEKPSIKKQPKFNSKVRKKLDYCVEEEKYPIDKEKPEMEEDVGDELSPKMK